MIWVCLKVLELKEFFLMPSDDFKGIFTFPDTSYLPSMETTSSFQFTEVQ